jgi:hypothetical protein
MYLTLSESGQRRVCSMGCYQHLKGVVTMRSKLCLLLGHDFKVVGAIVQKCTHCEKVKYVKVKL